MEVDQNLKQNLNHFYRSFFPVQFRLTIQITVCLETFVTPVLVLCRCALIPQQVCGCNVIKMVPKWMTSSNFSVLFPSRR